MADKLTKRVIKNIVKECLIELLAEGLSSHDNTENTSVRKTKTLKESMNSETVSTGRNKKLPKYLKGISSNDDNNSDLMKKEKFDQLAASITNDPVLSEMLMDTAQTTLQEQLAADSKKNFAPIGAGDKAQRLAESNNPEELFGEKVSSKWASLAFD